MAKMNELERPVKLEANFTVATAGDFFSSEFPIADAVVSKYSNTFIQQPPDNNSLGGQTITFHIGRVAHPSSGSKPLHSKALQYFHTPFRALMPERTERVVSVRPGPLQCAAVARFICRRRLFTLLSEMNPCWPNARKGNDTSLLRHPNQ